MKFCKRTEDGTTTYVSVREALAEANTAMMEGKRAVKTMSSQRGRHDITYTDGRHVLLVLVDEAGTTADPLPFRTLVTTTDNAHGNGKVALSRRIILRVGAEQIPTILYDVEFDDGTEELLYAHEVFPLRAGQDPEPATLIVGPFSSTCGNCRRNTLPSATHHTDVSGWTPQPGKGCGALFVDMKADNSALSDAALLRVRPDLPICRPAS